MRSILAVFCLKHDSTLKVVAWLLILSSVTGGILLPQPFYYISLGVLGIMILSKGHLVLSNLLVPFLLIVCLLSLIINNPPSFYHAWSRLGVYTLVVLVVGPMLYSKSAVSMRFRLVFYFLSIGAVLSVGSFFAYFLGINLFVREGELLEIGAGRFSGLMNHSMVLGPMSALSAILLFSMTLNFNKLENQSNRKRIILIVMMAFCCGACLLAASRISIVGLIVGLIMVVFVTNQGRIAKSIKILTIVVILVGASYPLWGDLTAFIIQKNQGNIGIGGNVFSSREDKFAARIYEFKSSPIIGIGFCVADPQFSGVNESNGRVEPSSSWLAVASMTGILGLLFFLPLCFVAAIKVWRIRDPLLSSILAGSLFFIFVHMIAEGYIYAPKNCLSMLFWAILGSIYGITTYEKSGGTFKLE